MRIHFIAIGGSAMHNLAIALHKKGVQVSGSDDEIFEPSKSRLEKYGLLPNTQGWNIENIDKELDAVVLGMHARIDNPELIKAKELGVKIYSYPEYLYEHSKNKKRIVIGGSHGKTTITAMILHVLKYNTIDFDFMVGAQLEGFEVMVKLTDSAPFMIIEGDEYLTSPIDPRPKFHLYRPDIALISGIAWDHINVFPTFENYVEQFSIFIKHISANGKLIYCDEDEMVSKIGRLANNKIEKFPYSSPDYMISEGVSYVQFNQHSIPLQFFGHHNLMNMEGARLVCNQLGIDDEHFFEAIKTFTGASKRLEVVKQTPNACFYKDFAHSPSKLKATIKAVKEQFPNRKLIACIELHTFSSLNFEFLKQYQGTMEDADVAIVYYNSHTIQLKKLTPISVEDVKENFGNKNLLVFTNSDLLKEELTKYKFINTNLLMMSSGNYDGINFDELANNLFL